MTAIYKRIYTKSSLNDVWFFEKDLILFRDFPIEFIEREFSGFISKDQFETISFDELDTRKEELKSIRPDIYTSLFETQIEDLNLNLDYIINHMKKYNVLPFDAFTTTLTEVITFDTWENLINAYESLATDELVNAKQEELEKYNNNLVEEFYLDDVKQNYIGRIGK